MHECIACRKMKSRTLIRVFEQGREFNAVLWPPSQLYYQVGKLNCLRESKLLYLSCLMEKVSRGLTCTIPRIKVVYAKARPHWRKA